MFFNHILENYSSGKIALKNGNKLNQALLRCSLKWKWPLKRVASAYLNMFIAVPHTVYISMFWTQIFSYTLQEDAGFIICQDNFSIVNMLFTCINSQKERISLDYGYIFA